MLGFIFFVHVLVCMLLGGIILMQSGRGGGLTESFSSAEAMFGARTSSFLIKGTTILASIYLVICLSLAYISSRRDRSLIDQRALSAPLPKEAQQNAVHQPQQAESHSTVNSKATTQTQEKPEDANPNPVPVTTAPSNR